MVWGSCCYKKPSWVSWCIRQVCQWNVKLLGGLNKYRLPPKPPGTGRRPSEVTKHTMGIMDPLKTRATYFHTNHGGGVWSSQSSVGCMFHNHPPKLVISYLFQDNPPQKKEGRTFHYSRHIFVHKISEHASRISESEKKKQGRQLKQKAHLVGLVCFFW